MADGDKIQDIGDVAISLAVAIIIVVVVALILVDFQDIQTDFTGIHDNETLAWAGNNTVIQLLEGRILETSIILYNNGTKINKGLNYTTTTGGINITNGSPEGAPAGQSEWVTAALNVSYDYKFGSAARNSTDKGLESQNTISGFFPLVALAAIGAIIIGIIIRFFLRREQV